MGKYSNLFDDNFQMPETQGTGRFSNLFDDFEPEPEPFKSNTLGSFGVGANNLLDTVGNVYGLVTGDFDNMATRQAERGREFYEQFKTDELFEKQSDLQQKIDSSDSFLGKVGTAVWGTVGDLDLLGNFLVEQAPMALLGGAAGKGVQLATGSVKAGVAAGQGTSAALQAGDVGGSVYNDLIDLPDEVWDQNAEYLALSQEVGSEQAKADIATTAARKAAGISSVISLVSANLIPDTAEKIIARGGVKGDGFFSKAFKSGLSEGFQEGIEEGGGQIAANINVQPFDPSRDTFEGVAQSAGLGALGGTIIGGAIGGLSPSISAATENAERERANVASQGGDNLDQANAAAGGFANTDLSDLRSRMGIPEEVQQSADTGTVKLPELANQFDQDTLQPTPFQPIVTPTPFQPQQEVPQLPFDLTEEILFADRVNQPERATRLRNAQAIYNRAQGTADEGLRARLIERANEIVGTEMSQEFLRQPPVRDPSEPLEGPVITADTDVNFDASYVEQGPVVATQRRLLLPQDNVIYQEPVEGAPTRFFRGSAGDGFATRKGAEAAMRSRQKAEPGFNWEIIPEGDRFILGGVRRETRSSAQPDPIDRYIEQVSQDAMARTLPDDAPGSSLREAYEAGDVTQLIGELDRVASEIEAAQEIPAKRTDAGSVDVLTAITRLGGIQTDDAVAQGIDPESFKGFVGKNRPVRSTGRTFDEMGEVLAENGFFPQRPTANEVVDVFTDALYGDSRIFMGEKQGQIQGLQQEQNYINSAINEIEREFGSLTDDEIAFVDQYYQESFNAIYGETGNAQQTELGAGGEPVQQAFAGEAASEGFGTRQIAGGIDPARELTTQERAEVERQLPEPAPVTQFEIADPIAQEEAAEQAELPSTAPEHRAIDQGVSKEELFEIADQFRQGMQGDFDGNNPITQVFKAPEKSEIVRLQDKSKAYVDQNGFMSKEQADQTVDQWRQNALTQGQDSNTRSENSGKIVLSLFDLTGSWAKPWAEAGYEVYTFDIQDDPIYGDINNFSIEFFNDLYSNFEGKDIHAILAACPCTDFASSGARWFGAKDEDGRTLASVDLVHQTLRTIEYFKPNIWAVENPVGRIEKMGGLPPWRLSFDPFHFGEDYTKKTLLWGRFNADLPIAPTEPTMGSKMHSQYGGKSLATKNARSETPEGFAYAFFEANNAVDNPIMAVGNKYDMMDARVIQNALDEGFTEQDISEVVDDPYYMEQDFEAADRALANAINEPTAEGVDVDEGFTLQSYTEQDIQNIESRDIEALEREAQIDRERENFTLDSRRESIAGTNDPLQRPQGTDLFGFSDVQQEARRDYGFEEERTRLTSVLNGKEDQEVDRLLRDAGLQVSGSKQEKIERIVSSLEAKFVVESAGFESQQQIEEAVRNGDIDARDMARWASGVSTSQQSVSTPQSATEMTGSSANIGLVVQSLSRITGRSIPYRTDSEQEAFESSPEQVQARDRLEVERSQAQSTKQSQDDWFESNRVGFGLWWSEASEQMRADVLSKANALGDTERTASRRIKAARPSALPNAATRAIIEWGARTGTSFTDGEMSQSDDPALFQRGRGATRTAIGDEKFNAVIDRVVGRDGNARNRVDVRSSSSELPQEIIESARQQGVDPASINAVYHRGRVYLVKDKLTTESQVEEALLHEGTHGGIDAMYKDEGVKKALNRMWAAMGGRKGFDKLSRELGIEENIRPYLEGSSLDEDVRNAVLVNEMLAYTGQQGSKKLRQRTREVIGAIREWLRNNTFLRLSRMRASDISLIAKRARDNFINNRANAESGAPSFIVGERERAAVEDGLYSNAEQVLLDEGGKIFKASNKNPEARVLGPQIYSFLKARGLKSDEDRYTGLEEFLTSDPKQRFTRDEVIQHLREEAVMLEEVYSSRESGAITEEDLEWGDSVPDTNQANYEYLWEDMADNLANGYYDNYGTGKAVEKAIFDDSDRAIDIAVGALDLSDEQQSRLSDRYTSDDKMRYLLQEFGNDAVYSAVKEEMYDEIDENMWQIAEDIYLENPYTNTELDTELASVNYVTISGNDEIGYSTRIGYAARSPDVLEDGVYSLEEAKVQAQQYLLEQGYLEFEDGETEVYQYFNDLQNETWDQYREIRMTTDGKWGTYPRYRGHFPEDNVLYNVISTDRKTDLGDTFVIEEMQSDWHSQIRKAGRTQDAERLAQVRRDRNEADDKERALFDERSEIEEDIQEPSIEEFKIIRNAFRRIDPYLTEFGREALFNESTPGSTAITADILDVDKVRSGASGYENFDDSYVIQDFLRNNRTGLKDYGEAAQLVAGYGIEDKARALSDKTYEYDVASARREALRKEERNEEAAPPDSPFRDDRYLELAVKRSIITAIEEGKTALAWSQADRVQARWSERFDYEAQYNRKIPKIVQKITGQKPVRLDVNGNEMFTVFDDNGEFWAVPLTDELKQKVTFEGLPMYQLDPEAGRVYPKIPVEESMADFYIRKLQDKFVPIKRVIQSIEEQTGRPIARQQNTYRVEEAFYNKTEEDLRQVEIRLVKPLIDTLDSTNISIPQLDEYVYARHAEERNREMAAINPALPDGGSGMMNAEAKEILDKVAKSGKQSDYDNLANQVYAIIELTLELQLAGGLISEETNSSWRDGYDYYVPLKGFAVDEKDSNGNAIPRTGKGFQVTGPESFRAMGRSSRAASPTIQAISDLTEKIIRNRKNEVGQSFLALVEQYPDPEVWQVFTAQNPDTKRRFKNGKVDAGSRMTELEMAQSDDYFGVKRDGVGYYIKIADKRIINAMKNVGPDQLDGVTKYIRPITRYLASINTAYNPQFAFTNFARDIQTAVMNIAAEGSMEGGLIEGEKIAAKAAANVKKAIFAIESAIREDAVNDDKDPEASEYRRYYQEFLNDGAKTGYFDSPDVDKIAKNIESQLRSSQPGTLNKFRRGAVQIGKFVERWNSAIENGVRLSTYVEARKAGVDRDLAASMAKNLTVNFNRKGEVGNKLNAWYMFFNPAVQGTANFLRTLSPIQVNSQGNLRLQKKMNLAQKIAGGITASTIGYASFMREFGGEDDDGEAYWDKIPSSIRERNLVILKPGSTKLDSQGNLDEGSYYKWPLPYGYNFFYNIGDAIEGALKGSRRRKEKILGDLVASFLTSFAPLSARSGENLSEDILLTGSPSFLVPVTEIAINQNFFGNKIYPENFPAGAQKADAYLYYPSTKEGFKQVAQFLNDVIGGGSEYRSGELMGISTDVSPETLEAVIEYAGGGLLRTATGAVDTVARAGTGRKLELSNIPFARIFVGADSSDYSDIDTFYKRRQEIINARKEYKDSMTPEERDASDLGFKGVRTLYPRMNNTYNQLKRIRDREMSIRDRDDISPAEKEEMLDDLREQKDDYVDRFNLYYDQHIERMSVQ